jgi:hypothetical protein
VSRRQVLYLVVAVVILHAGAFLLLGRMRALPKARVIPPPNFGYQEEVFEDTKTGERTIYREIRVSTKLADPKKLPPTPVPRPPEPSTAAAEN